MIVPQTPFACHRFACRDAGLLDELAQSLSGFAVNGATPGDDERSFCLLYKFTARATLA